MTMPERVQPPAIGDRYHLKKRHGAVRETAVYEIVRHWNPNAHDRDSYSDHAVAKKVLKNGNLSVSVQVCLPFTWFKHKVER